MCSVFFRMVCVLLCFFFFFFNDTATTEIYTLSLHDALPILIGFLEDLACLVLHVRVKNQLIWGLACLVIYWSRSEEHTSELQSQSNLVCRLLLEKKKSSNSVPPRRSICATRSSAIAFQKSAR